MKALTVCKYTFKELYQSKILFNVVILGLFIVGLSYIATELTYGARQRVALDFGLGLASLAATGISIFLGVGLITSELDKHTIYAILSRPIGREAFLVGKILGMLLILLTNTSILYALSLSIYVLLGGTPSELIAWTFLFTFIEAALILILVIFFSITINKTLSVLCILTLVVLGHAINPSMELNFVTSRPLLQKFIQAYSYVFPDFSRLNIKPFILYQKPLDLDYLASSACYGIFYFLALLTLTLLVFKRKSLY